MDRPPEVVAAPEIARAHPVKKPKRPPPTRSPWRWGGFPAQTPTFPEPSPLVTGGRAALANAVHSPLALSPVPNLLPSPHLDEPWMAHHALCVLSPTNPLRLRVARLVKAWWFDRSIDLCIVANSVSLALRDVGLEEACRYARSDAANGLLFSLDVAFTSVFLCELILKLIVHGAVRHPGAYYRDGWNWIDGFVAIVSLLGLLPRLCTYLSGLSALRAVRLLRRMRAIRSMRSFAVTVQALIDATPKLVHVGVLLLFTFICFGILGVQLFMGSLRGKRAPLTHHGLLHRPCLGTSFPLSATQTLPALPCLALLDLVWPPCSPWSPRAQVCAGMRDRP
jgi:hypothetical protein